MHRHAPSPFAMDLGEQARPSPRPTNEPGAAIKSSKGTTSERGQSRPPPSSSSQPPSGPHRSALLDPDEDVRRRLQETATPGREGLPPPYLAGLCPAVSPGGSEEGGGAGEALPAAAPMGSMRVGVGVRRGGFWRELFAWGKGARRDLSKS
jgi:hypothetical protein